jgi:hypothetical protein
MEKIVMKHQTLYTSAQFALLSKLIEVQYGHKIFVCERDPADKTYSRTRKHPQNEGGDNYFSIAIWEDKKYWIPLLFDSRKILKVGKLYWKFEGDEFAMIWLVVNPHKKSMAYINELEELVTALKKEIKCRIFTNWL